MMMMMMAYLCPVRAWHANLIVYIADVKVSEPYLRCLCGDQYDIVDAWDRKEPGLDLPEWIKTEPAWDHPAVIVAARKRCELIRQSRLPIDSG
jgi:hypothetical protein